MDHPARAVELLRLNEGVLTSRQHPRAALNTLLQRQRIVRVFTGVFVDAELLTCRRTRYAAALALRPHAVLWGASAVAAITADATPFVKGEVIQLAQREGRAAAGLVIHRRSVPEVRYYSGLRCPSAAVVAVEAAARDDGRICETLLREGLIGPADLAAALAQLEGSTGQGLRRSVVVSHLDNPWSGGERDLHRVLRAEDIVGWLANVAVEVGGFVYHPDLLFAAAMLVVEFDGFAVHGTKQAFESDRIRQNRLVLAGFRVLRYTWQRLQTDPAGIVAEIRQALAQGEPVVC